MESLCGPAWLLGNMKHEVHTMQEASSSPAVVHFNFLSQTHFHGLLLTVLLVYHTLVILGRCLYTIYGGECVWVAGGVRQQHLWSSCAIQNQTVLFASVGMYVSQIRSIVVQNCSDIMSRAACYLATFQWLLLFCCWRGRPAVTHNRSVISIRRFKVAT